MQLDIVLISLKEVKPTQSKVLSLLDKCLDLISSPGPQIQIKGAKITENNKYNFQAM